MGTVDRPKQLELVLCELDKPSGDGDSDSPWTVARIDKVRAELIIKNKHYSKRASIFWDAFALIIDGMVEGVVVYGQPSAPIQKHAFANRDFRLYELSRLVIQTGRKNAASFLVGRSLSLLPKPCAVVSYADSAWGHSGIVYQSTNWIYTGKTVSHDHLYVVNGERIHPMTLRDKGITNPKAWAKENGIQTIKPEGKHRYFFINASKQKKREMMKSLRYPVIKEYPKSPKTTYDSGPHIDVKAP